MTQNNDENINITNNSNNSVSYGFKSDPLVNVGVGENSPNKKTIDNLRDAGTKINEAKLGSNFRNATKGVIKGASNVGKSVGEFLNPSSGNVQRLVSKIPEGVRNPQNPVIRQQSGGFNNMIQSSSSQPSLNGTLILQNLQRTPAQRKGMKGRPQTKVVIKKKGLFDIGGTQSDFEKLITLENMTQGRIPQRLDKVINTSGQLSSTPIQSMNTNTGFTSRVSDFTRPSSGSVNTERLLQLSNNKPVDLNNLSFIASGNKQMSFNQNKFTQFLGKPKTNTRQNAQDKLRRFL